MSDNRADHEKTDPCSMTLLEIAKRIMDRGSLEEIAELRDMADKAIKRRTPLITGLINVEEAREIHLKAELRKCEEKINKEWAERIASQIKRNDVEWTERISEAKEKHRAAIVSAGIAFGADRDYILGRLVEWCGLDQAEAEEYLQNALKERAAADRE